MRNPYKQLEKSIGYRFRKRRYLETALTHRSYRYESPDIDGDNQRLEFLGDAVLGLAAAAHLYTVHPDFEEGDLTRTRSRLTNIKALARIAESIQLGSFIRLGRGEQQSGGSERASTLGDALEAILGAAYLDGGPKAAARIFKKLFIPELSHEEEELWKDNPKGALQEFTQRKWKLSPRYRLVREEGPAHSKRFAVEVVINSIVKGTGEGSSKREAEIAAAIEAHRNMQRMEPDKPAENSTA